MKMFAAFCILLLVACNPYKALRDARFEFASEKGPGGVAIRVPKGWKSAATNTDSLGRQVRIFDYGGGTVYYVAYAPRGGDMQPIPRDRHVPRINPQGDTVYKDQYSGGRIWREDKKGLLRAGYINVTEGKNEALFDSAVNSVRAIRTGR